jgi:hypothetical protein
MRAPAHAAGKVNLAKAPLRTRRRCAHAGNNI